MGVLMFPGHCCPICGQKALGSQQTCGKFICRGELMHRKLKTAWEDRGRREMQSRIMREVWRQKKHAAN